MAFTLSGSTITQSGTDTLPTTTGNGFTATSTPGGLYTDCSIGNNVLAITGTLTIDGTTRELIGTDTARVSVRAGGKLILDGRKSSAGNSPMPLCAMSIYSQLYGGDAIANADTASISLYSTNAASPAIIEMYDTLARFGSTGIWPGTFAELRTFGAACWILNNRGNTTSKSSMRVQIDNCLDFQAGKTYVGVWLIFGRPQKSLKGFTPIFVDGPEINGGLGPSVAQQIDIEDYDSSYITASYYPGAKLVLHSAPQVRLINNLVGTNMPVSFPSLPINNNVLTYAKRIVCTQQDSVGVKLSGGTFYLQPVGTAPTGIRARGQTTDIVWSTASKESTTDANGNATILFEFAVRYTRTVSTADTTIDNFFCTGTTRGAETHLCWSSRYGYNKLTQTVTLAGNGSATPTFTHSSLPTTDKIVANVVTSGITVNFSTKSITLTAAATTQRIYDNIQRSLNLSANLYQLDFSMLSGSELTLVSPWALVGGENIPAGQTVKANTITVGGSTIGNLLATTGISGLPTTGAISTGGTLGFGTGSTLAAAGNLSASSTAFSGSLAISTATARDFTLSNCTGQINLTVTGGGSVRVILSGSTPRAILPTTLPTGVTVMVLCSVADSTGAAFNIVARYGTTGAYTDLGYQTAITSASYLVDYGSPVELCMWRLGYLSFVRTIATTSGGFNLSAEMTAEPDVDTTLNVASYLANITVTSTAGKFRASFNANMDIDDIEYTKAIVHRLLGLEASMRALLPPGTSSVLEIESDEIQINQPAVFLDLGTGANRVVIRGFFNTAPAKAIDPTYVINPERPSDNRYVQLPLVKPALDTGQLALAVWQYATRTLTADPGAAGHTATQTAIAALPTAVAIRQEIDTNSIKLATISAASDEAAKQAKLAAALSA